MQRISFRCRSKDSFGSKAPSWPLLFVPASANGTGLIEQSLPDILPDRMWSVAPNRIRLLNFYDAKAAHAFYTQHMERNFREAILQDRQR